MSPASRNKAKTANFSEKGAGRGGGNGRSSRKAEILEVAARLFRENGYDGTSIQDIVDEVGILKGSIYHYIKGKEDLLYWIIQDAHAGQLDTLNECLQLDTGAYEKLERLIRAHAVIATQNDLKASVYEQDFRSLSEEHRQEIIESRRKYERRVRGLIAEAQEQGVLSDDIPPVHASRFVLGTLNSIHRWYRGGGDVEEFASFFTKFALRGLGARNPLNERPNER